MGFSNVSGTFQMGALIKVTFQGVDGSSGPSPAIISVPGIKAGDVVVSVSHGGSEMGPGGGPNHYIGDQPIPTDDQINQYGGNDWSALTFTAILVRFT